MPNLSYHAETFAYLGLEPRRTSASIDAVNAWEAKHNITLPPAVREWYEIEGVAKLWQQHMPRDVPTPLSKLVPLRWLRISEGDESVVVLAEPRDKELPIIEVAHPGIYLKFLHEIDCGIATILRVDGDDPAILLFGDAHEPPGTEIIGTFPAYVFDAFFDQDSQTYRGVPFALEAMDRMPNEDELAILRAKFHAGPVGVGGMLGWSYRFYDRGNWIIIGHSPYYSDPMPTWEIRSRSAEELAATLRVMCPLADLARTLTVTQGDETVEVLHRLAAEFGAGQRPLTADEHLRLGNVRSKAAWESKDVQQYRQAIGHYTSALQADPSEWRARDGRMECYMRIGEFQAAIREYTTMIETDPSPHWYTKRAGALLKAGRYDEAAADMLHNLQDGRSQDEAIGWGESLAKAGRLDLIPALHQALAAHSPAHSWVLERFEWRLQVWGVSRGQPG